MRIKNVAGASGVGDHILPSVKNADTVLIPKGAPLILVLNGTGDGYNVVLPSTAGQIKSNAYIWGVSVQSIPVGGNDDAYGTGYCPYALVVQATRSASSASWSSSASVAGGAILSIDTTNNAFAVASASVGTGALPFAVLVDNIPALVASASATSDSRTAILVAARCFLRII